MRRLAALSALGARLHQVQVTDGARYATLAHDNSVSMRMIAPPRGRILDRFGVVLASNKQNWRALLVAEQTTDIGRTLDNFSRLVPLDERERVRIERDARRHRRFIPILVRDYLSWDDMARIEVNAPDLPGILVDVGATRVYPFADQLAHLVGYVAPPNRNGRGWGPDDVAAGDPGRAAPASRNRGNRLCAAAPARCSLRSTRSGG